MALIRYQIPAHQLLWAYAIDDHNRVHAMMSNQVCADDAPATCSFICLAPLV
jgi:hypothetical protein